MYGDSSSSGPTRCHMSIRRDYRTHHCQALACTPWMATSTDLGPPGEGLLAMRTMSESRSRSAWSQAGMDRDGDASVVASWLGDAWAMWQSCICSVLQVMWDHDVHRCCMRSHPPLWMLPVTTFLRAPVISTEGVWSRVYCGIVGRVLMLSAVMSWDVTHVLHPWW